MITIQQINQFKEQAKRLGKNDEEIDNYINQKLNSQQQTTFSPRSQTPTSVSPTPVQPQQSSNRVIKGTQEGLYQAKETGVGIGKGLLSTLNSISGLGQKALQKLTGVSSQTSSLPKNAITPTSEYQKQGFVGEQIGEFFIPASKASKTTKALDIAVDGTKLSRAAKVGTKIIGRATIEGASAGTVRLSQTGSGKEAAKAGLLSGGLAGASKGVGEALRGARIPEWFYSKVFRTSSDDMLQELKTIARSNLQKTDPAKYKQLVDAGIIKIGKTGQPVVNETLAKEALDKGLKGSLKNMATQVINDTDDLELASRQLTKSVQKPLALHSNYTTTLQEIAADYRNVGLGEHAQLADDLLKGIQNNTTTAENALKIRRFFDGMRIRSSYNPSNKLTQSQTHFKELTDNLRSQLAKEVPGLKAIMREYRFNIEALEALAKEAARRGNREVIGLLDTVFFGSGVATGNPAFGAALGLGRRVLNSPAGSTKAGQFINRIGSGTKAGSALRAGAAYKATSTQNNQPQPFQRRK